VVRKVADFARECADREAIRDCLTRYYRGIDRLDAELLKNVFWPEATIDQGGTFKGLAYDFVAFAFPALKSMEQTQHLMGNLQIEIDGTRAHTETYVLAYHGLHQPRVADLFAGVRYIDQLEARSDEWRILHRVLVIDWFREIRGSADWERGFLGFAIGPPGRRPQDPSYWRP
jgi:hypothetical protein